MSTYLVEVFIYKIKIIIKILKPLRLHRVFIHRPNTRYRKIYCDIRLFEIWPIYRRLDATNYFSVYWKWFLYCATYRQWCWSFNSILIIISHICKNLRQIRWHMNRTKFWAPWRWLSTETETFRSNNKSTTHCATSCS